MTLIDTAMAAVVLGITPQHVRRLIKQGDLTNYGTARQIVLDLDQVSALATHRCSPN